MHKVQYIPLFRQLLTFKTDANASGEQDACQSIPIENYNLGFRVGSIFIIFATTTIGTYAPILLHRISPYKQGDARDWILTIGKFCKFVHELLKQVK